MLGRLVLILMLSGFLCACGPVSTDPRHGGLIGGIKGIYGGEYEKRKKDREDMLQGEKSRQQLLEDHSAALEQEIAIRDQALASEKELISKMNADLVNMEDGIRRLQAKSESQKAEISSLQENITALKGKLDKQQQAIRAMDKNGGSSADPARYQMLLKEQRRLKEEYRRLLEFSKALAEANN